jgi:ADP-ribose pyrophosphatase YjhB (NUDIX family)
VIHDDHPSLAEVRFCPRCGTAVEAREKYGQLRPTCPSCGYVHFVDPKLVVAVLAHRHGKVLLHRRTMNPGRGRWTFPSGFVDAGEVVEAAAIREAREETNADVELTGLLGVFSAEGERIVLVAYEGVVLNEDIYVGDEAESSEVGWFDPAHLPEMAFERDAEIIWRWHSRAPLRQE